MSEPSGGEQINWNPSMQIAVPMLTTEARLAIRRSDWHRIRRNVLQLKESQLNLPVWYSICFGFAASSLVSIAPIAVTKDLPAWVLPSYLFATLFALILGIILARLHKRLNQERQSEVENLDADMDEIQRAFGSQSIAGTNP